MFRVPVRLLKDALLPSRQLANAIERYSAKPLSDGLSADLDGNLYITDVEHGSVMIVGADREPKTLIQSGRIRWPDALSFGPGGWLYLADSAIPDQVLKSRDHMKSRAPYYIYRFRPGHTGNPGH
jgi:sugar lactone lactonase YvrE